MEFTDEELRMLSSLVFDWVKIRQEGRLSKWVGDAAAQMYDLKRGEALLAKIRAERANRGLYP